MRKPVVTRTITSTKVVALCIDVNSEELFDCEVTLPRTYKTAELLLKATKKANETEDVKVISIKNTQVINAKYSMSEEDFIAHGHIVD